MSTVGMDGMTHTTEVVLVASSAVCVGYLIGCVFPCDSWKRHLRRLSNKLSSVLLSGAPEGRCLAVAKFSWSKHIRANALEGRVCIMIMILMYYTCI